jgi:hypothetical protein
MTRVLMAAVPWDARRLKAVKAVKEAVPDLEITWDENHNAYDTFVRNLRAAGDDAAIFLEDDILLTTDWRDKVEAVIESKPDEVVQFFSMRKADLEVGSRWEPGRSFLGNLCWYAPAGLAADLAAYLPDWEPHVSGEHPTGYDFAMADYFKATGRRYWIEVPNLVDHRPGPSAINPRRPPRVSRSFVP